MVENIELEEYSDKVFKEIFLLNIKKSIESISDKLSENMVKWIKNKYYEIGERGRKRKKFQ